MTGGIIFWLIVVYCIIFKIYCIFMGVIIIPGIFSVALASQYLLFCLVIRIAECLIWTTAYTEDRVAEWLNFFLISFWVFKKSNRKKLNLEWVGFRNHWPMKVVRHDGKKCIWERRIEWLRWHDLRVEQLEEREKNILVRKKWIVEGEWRSYLYSVGCSRGA